MADKANAWDDNAPGKWYVDKECIMCGTCVDTAAENFKESGAGDHACVAKQPEGNDEQKACKEAMEQCPVEAIGDDGE